MTGRMLCLLLTIAPLTAAAQDVRDGGVLRYMVGENEVGRETFVRTADYLETETIMPVVGLRLRYRMDFDAGDLLSRFTAQIRRLSDDGLVADFSARTVGDSIRWEQVDGQGARQEGTAAGGAHTGIGGQSVASIFDLVHRARGRDTTFRMWAAGAATQNVTIAFTGDAARISLGGLPVTAVLAPDRRVAALEIPAQRLRVERASDPTALPPLAGLTPPTPDYSAPAGAPYRAEEVRVPVTPRAGEPFELAGTLTLPIGGRPRLPVVITLTGSGPQDRDENLFPLLPAYRPFREVADRLAEAGIAVLRVDDRGFGASGGSRTEATMEDFADDVAAQVSWLRAREDIDPDRIAFVGHSEGGVVGPMVAAQDPRIAAVVIMAGTAKPGVEVLRDQLMRPIEVAPGLTDEQRAAAITQTLEALAADTASPVPWVRHFRTYDPLTTIRQVTQPVLIMHGALDRQVTVGQADTLALALREAGNLNVSVRVYPDLNHLFLVAPGDGSPTEYISIEDTRLSRQVLDDLAEWLAQQLAVGG